MALPFQRVAVELGNALDGSQIEAGQAALLKKGIAHLFAAEESQVKHMGRFIEIQ
ncbi:hypothetical protein D3C81_2130990 [compost metagenome]